MESGKPLVLKTEPGFNWLRRLKTKTLRLLPIESQI